MLEAEIATARRGLEIDVSLMVEAGSPLALVGPSGAGKSTVLAAIAGLHEPRRGRISCGGVNWLDSGASKSLAPEQRRCGYVFQGYALFGHLSARRNVAYGLGHLPRRERRAAATALLGRFGVAALAEAKPGDLSGGERQRVALARALGSRPRALLLDEPLAALDATTRAAARRELIELIGEAGVPSILVTHDFTEASALAGRVAVIESGRIVQSDSPGELAARPATSFVAEITGSSVLTGHSRGHSTGPTEVTLRGGASVLSTDPSESGPVSISVHPWDISLEPPGSPARGSQQNRLPGIVRSVAPIGSRVRIGLDVGQPLIAEITEVARQSLGLHPGSEVIAAWKAAATRLIPR